MGFEGAACRIPWKQLDPQRQVQDAPHSRPGPLVGGASRKSWVLSYTRNLHRAFEEDVKHECSFRDSDGVSSWIQKAAANRRPESLNGITATQTRGLL